VVLRPGRTIYRRAAGKQAPRPGRSHPRRDDERLTNEDLATLEKQTWTSYNFFAFWMSDVHGVGGYITAGSLFALGLAAWQVLVALLVGITIVYFLCNLVARPSQAMPYPVISRVSFGVMGANIPASSAA
jgi:NCS1 family nucleobase:cation symporter-1